MAIAGCRASSDWVSVDIDYGDSQSFGSRPMSRGRNQRVGGGLIRPPTETSAHAIRLGSFLRVRDIQKFAFKVQLQAFERWIESSRQPSDCVPSRHRPRDRSQIADSIQLTLLVPIRMRVLSPLNRLPSG
jgi:hypothetical protein